MSEEKKTRLEEWKEEHADCPDLVQAIEAACTQYGEDEIEVLRLTKPVGVVAIFRTPTSADYNRFMANILDDKPASKAAAGGILARACVVYPNKITFGQMVDRYSAIGSAVLKPLMKLAGSELAERGKE